VTLADGIFLGTSSFTSPGWHGSFYPKGMPASDRLAFYAEHFDTVEIDSTFYGTPSSQTVKEWSSKTPGNFIFSAKIPQVITHEKVLVGCNAEFDSFLNAMDSLDTKLGPMVFQFPYFNHVLRGEEFLARLKAFLPKLPAGHKFAIEIRNKSWFTVELAGLLRKYRVALVLADRPGTLRPEELAKKFDPTTADWTYIRWLGDRKALEEVTKVFNRVVVDRKEDMRTWVDCCYQIKQRGIPIYAYANNHYAGFAPATVEQFRDLWYACGLPGLERVRRMRIQTSLFDP
jgi:uncharacterized protein YecE (DUF72 family)